MAIITPHELKDKIDRKDDFLLVDVRTQEEFKEGHIPQSIIIPIEQLEVVAEDTLKDKESEIILYCRSGKRSAQGVVILNELGYENVINFGGIIDWPYEIDKE